MVLPKFDTERLRGVTTTLNPTQKMKFFLSVLVVVATSVVIATLFISLIYSMIETPSEKAALYEAWKAANPSYAQLSFQHWEVLRKKDMLPGVDYAAKHSKEARDAANASAIMSGFAAGMAAGK